MTYTGPNAPVANLAPEIVSAAQSYAEVTGKLAAADGDVEKAYDAWKQGDDPEAVKIREAIAKLEAKLNESAKKNVKVETLSDEDKAKLTAEQNVLKEKVTKGLKAVSMILASFEVDKEGVEAWVKEFSETNPTRGKRGRAVGSVGSSLPRMRAEVTITGGELFPVPTKFESMGKVASALSVELKDLQLAFAAEAKVEHDKISSVKTPVTFTFKVHENGATYTLTTHPKSTKDTASPAK